MFPRIFRDSQEIWTDEFVRYCQLRVHVQVYYCKKSRKPIYSIVYSVIDMLIDNAID